MPVSYTHLIEAVRPMRTAEPHQRLVFGILAFGGASDDALVDVEVLSLIHI